MTTTLSARRALVIALAVGVVGWVALWFGTTPRAGWDSLVYHKHALEYAGLAPAKADALSWQIFTRYADPDLVGYVTASLDGEDWHFPAEPDGRWALQYRMRPAYPALVAAAYPVLGARAPLAVSAFAVVLFVMSTFVGMFLLAGIRVAVVATGLGMLNVLLTQWLVALAPDGLAIALWAVTLSTGALWMAQRRPIWLGALALAVLGLCLTRPLGVLAPLVFLLCAVGAAVARAREWRAFLVATIVAAVPAVAVTALFAAAGFPGWMDLLQDLPTGHFTVPDVPDPIGWIINNALFHLNGAMTLGLAVRPVLLLALAGSVVGLLLPRRWWTVPFIAALPVVLLSHLLHPVTTELDRTLAPAWVSIHAGIALLLVLGAVRWRPQVLAAVESFTRPEGQPEERTPPR